jgi:hypothetical protein
MDQRHTYYRFVLLGFVLGFTSASVLTLINTAITVEPEELENRFEVVDKYRNCNVVKWNGNGHYREYKFFLDCPSQRHSVIQNDRG